MSVEAGTFVWFVIVSFWIIYNLAVGRARPICYCDAKACPIISKQRQQTNRQISENWDKSEETGWFLWVSLLDFSKSLTLGFFFPFEISEWPTKLICKICNTMWDLKTNPKFIQEHDNSKEHKKNVIRFNLELNFLFVSKSRNRRRIIQQKYVFCKIYKCD